MDLASDVWIDMMDRFSQGNSFRIAELFEEIYGFCQDTLIVIEYFIQLKSLMLVFRSLPTCDCTIPSQCNAMIIMKEYQQSIQVICFLKGLNDFFSK